MVSLLIISLDYFWIRLGDIADPISNVAVDFMFNLMRVLVSHLKMLNRLACGIRGNLYS